MQSIRKNKERQSTGSTSLRINNALYGKISEASGKLPGMSANAFGVEAIEAILKMIDQPAADRSVPKLVMMMDAVKETKPLVGKQINSEPDLDVKGSAVGAVSQMISDKSRGR